MVYKRILLVLFFIIISLLNAVPNTVISNYVITLLLYLSCGLVMINFYDYVQYEIFNKCCSYVRSSVRNCDLFMIFLRAIASVPYRMRLCIVCKNTG